MPDFRFPAPWDGSDDEHIDADTDFRFPNSTDDDRFPAPGDDWRFEDLTPANPSNDTAPKLSGSNEVGTPLLCLPGTWDGQPEPTFTYQWKNNGVDIPGATSNTYTPVAADEGDTITCEVTAFNIQGTDDALSNSRTIVWPRPTYLGGINTLYGTAGVAFTPVDLSVYFIGQDISFSATGLPAGMAVDSAGELTGTPAAAGGFSPIITATNSGGVATGTIQLNIANGVPTAPTIANPGTISGTPEVGQTLSVTGQSVTGSPAPSVSYLWLRDGNTIAGATGPTYTLTAADDETDISRRITASNAAGSDNDVTATVAVTYPAPVWGAIPAQSWEEDSAITPLDLAAYVTGDDLTFSSADLPGGLSLSTAGLLTGTPPTPQAASNSTITAVNSGGSDDGTVSITITSTNFAPNVTNPGTIAGTPEVGETLSVTGYAATGTPTPTATYQWKRDSVDIAGATSATYDLVEADAGTNITREVTATNSEGNDSDTTAAVAVTYAAPLAADGLTSQSYVQDTGDATVDASVDFTVAGDADLSSVSWSVSGAGATIDSAGVVTIPTDAELSNVTVTVTATTSGGSDESSFPVSVTENDLVLYLIDADGPFDDISRIRALGDGAVVGIHEFQNLAAATFTFEAVYNGATPGSVHFEYQLGEADEIDRSENAIRYVMTNTVDDLQWNGIVLGTGVKTLTVTIYSDPGATGSVVATRTIEFEIKDTATTAPSAAGEYLEHGSAIGSLNRMLATWTGDPHVSETFAWTVNSVLKATTSTYTFLPSEDGQAFTVEWTRTNAAGSDTATVSGTVAYPAPEWVQTPPNRVFTNGVSVGTVDIGQYAINATSFSISPSVPAGLSFNTTNGHITGVPSAVSPIDDYTVTSTNAEGSSNESFTIQVVDLQLADQTIEFGEDTGEGEGGAQGRDSSGEPIDFTAINSQPNDNWEIVSGKLVLKSGGTLTSETINVSTSEGPYDAAIEIVSNAVSVRTAAEWTALNKNFSTVPQPDYTVIFRAGCTITKTQTAQFGGSEGSKQQLYGTVTFRGEQVPDFKTIDPADWWGATLEGWRAAYTNGGAIIVKDMGILAPPGERVQSTRSDLTGTPMCIIEGMLTTDLRFEDCCLIGDPEMLEWPGRSADNGGNDWGTDPWGCLMRINLASGSIPDQGFHSAQTITASGRTRAITGMRHISGTTYEIQVDDQGGKPAGINDNLGGEGITNQMSGSFTTSGGASGTILSPPGGTRQASNNAYSYIVKGPRMFDFKSGKESSRTLVIHGCRCWCSDSMIYAASHEELIIEECDIAYYTQDAIKPIGVEHNYGPATKSQRLIVRRNDMHHHMESYSDMGAVHCDHIQFIFGSFDNEVQIYHNRILENGRGHGQQYFLSPGIDLVDSVIAGNIHCGWAQGNATQLHMKNNVKVHHNSGFVWTPDNGGSPETSYFPLQNVARYFTSGAATNCHVEKELQTKVLGGSVPGALNPVAAGEVSQPAAFTGLGGSTPWMPQTFEELMTCATTKTGFSDMQRGAINSTADWSNYPEYVATDSTSFPGTTFALADLDPGELPPDGPPTLDSPIADQNFVQNSGDVTIDLDTVFGDADDYSVSGLSASVAGSTLTLNDDTVRAGVTITVTATNDQPGFASDTFTLTITTAPAAPVLSSPSAAKNGETACTGTVSCTSASGTLWWVVTTSGTQPSIAQIKAGQNSTGAAAAADGSQSISGSGVQNISDSGLTAATEYYIHYVANNAGGDSNRVSSSSFTTDAPAGLGTPVLRGVNKSTVFPYVGFIELSASNFTTDPIAVMIALNHNGGVSDPAVITVTIGASGRDEGTGTALSEMDLHNRFRHQAAIFKLEEPSAGSQTIQITVASNQRSIAAACLQFPGATSISGATGNDGDTSSGTFTLSGTNDNIGIFASGVEYDGSASLTGITASYSGDTGDTNSNDDLNFLHGYEVIASGEASMSFTTGAARRFAWVAAEVS